MFRQYDFEHACGHVHTDLVDVPHGTDPADLYPLDCPACGASGLHRRVISMPAVYTYEKAFMPEVHGGKWDTMGGRALPRLPTLPNGATYDQARDIFRSKEYVDKASERLEGLRQGKAKKQRAAAIAKGAQLDLRNCPLPGDPPLERMAPRKRKVR